MAVDRAPLTGSRRPVGRRAGIDLEQIVRAARSLDVGRLTVQAVADKLGVDRKAVRHHVTDRETLLRFVALDAFSESAAAVDIPEECSWQDACRSYATAFADAVIALDALAEHLPPDASIHPRFGEPVEAVSRKLVEAGFSDEAALRSLALLNSICMAHAQDTVFVMRDGERPRRRLAQETLDGRDQQFSTFARMVALGIDTYDRRQFDMSIDAFLLGVEALHLR
ncbi:TetR Family Transcriptional Regulator [Streptomyces leeuwenhoekii]|uniref:TetR Family Transcriptional Regulator n=2 Tax=Streptomyces leeuwenhoekii TaxID=1437453 RepID=A0A0F7VYL3_STRLW|nr:TetR/AcrR family transcriptional regulator C-terminal domain-containing protein [Streptomyces leeuwenhoekii]CQR65574.1 TetR Family Transcriptional Regulator [Streptomyces leeuwenhoekii]